MCALVSHVFLSCVFQVNRPLTMKKDGIQTRNRKMSTKGKKKKHGVGMNDFLKPLDKPFATFSPPNINPAMHTPVPTYMAGGSLGGGYMPTSHHSQMHSMGGMGNYGVGFSSGYSLAPTTLSSQSQGLSSSYQVPSSGLNLTTNTSMVGAMA